MEIVFGGSGHQFINVVKFRLGPEFPDFFMKSLDFKTIPFDTLIELRLEVLNHVFLFPQLLIFIVNNSLKSLNRLLCGLSDSCIFFFVISFDLFLTVEEPSGIGLELTAGEFGLHDKGVGGNVHLASKVHEFVDAGLRHDVFDCGFEVVELTLFVHELLFEFGDFVEELFGVLIVVLVASG
jgi:hypothetical protein